jgi:mannose-6-phosphate isomerase-like protein (cupin superfamily)
MKTKLFIMIAVVVGGLLALNGRGQEPDGPASASPSTAPEATMTPANSPVAGAMAAPEFKKLSEIKWDKVLPDLGENSPEICFLHVDPTTHATQLLIRTPKAIHIRKHWHTANETHMIVTGTVKFECEGKKAELGPGSFNYMPAKMVHEAWLPANSLTFISVDGAWDVNWVEGPPTSADLSRTY